MKLLLDHNLSPKLVKRLADIYPDSKHVAELGMAEALDREVWEYAREHQFLLVTKDADFNEFQVVLGFPPKIIWIRRGNCSTATIETILRQQHEAIETLVDDEQLGLLVLYR